MRAGAGAGGAVATPKRGSPGVEAAGDSWLELEAESARRGEVSSLTEARDCDEGVDACGVEGTASGPQSGCPGKRGSRMANEAAWYRFTELRWTTAAVYVCSVRWPRRTEPERVGSDGGTDRRGDRRRPPSLARSRHEDCAPSSEPQAMSHNGPIDSRRAGRRKAEG